jgi:hypothetical protein
MHFLYKDSSSALSLIRTQALLLCVVTLLLPSVRAANAPAFNVSPSKVYLDTAVSGAPPAPQVIVVNNTVANSVLKWLASVSGTGAPYCIVTPSQGTLVDQSAVLVSISASVPTQGGTYSCTVTLSDNGSSPKATNSGTVTVNYAVYGKSTTPPPPNTMPPDVPQDVTVTATGLGTVSFNWHNGGDSYSQVAGYDVYRDGEKLAVTGLNSYQDSGLATASYHTYAVAAFDAYQNTSAQTPAKAVTTFAPVPSGVATTYASLYQGLESDIATDIALLNPEWTGVKYPVNYSASLTSANDNGGLRWNFTNLTNVNQELSGLQAIGINAVMVTVGFPIFDQNFYEFIGQTPSQAQQTVANYESFYQLVAQAIHGRKDSFGKPMRMIVEANPLLTVDGTSTTLNATGYYQSLSFTTYEQRRSANTVATAQYVQPDYLLVQSEPDTDARDGYRPELNTPATDVAMVQLIVNNLQAANIPGLHSTIMLGSGMGSWQANWQEYLGTPGTATGLLGITGLDGIDNHVYYLTGEQSSSGLNAELNVSLQMIAAAHAAGKFASIAEFWLNKSLIAGASNSDVEARDTFSFWAPLDQEFMPMMFKLANANSLEYLSAFNDYLFWAYEPYSALPCVPIYPGTGSQNLACDTSILAADSAAALLALGLGQLSSLGTSYQADIAAYWLPH